MTDLELAKFKKKIREMDKYIPLMNKTQQEIYKNIYSLYIDLTLANDNN